MDTNAKVPPVSPVAEPSTSQTKPDPTPSPDQQSAGASLSVPAYIAEPADYRLVIDKDPVSGLFIYKTVDRVTGETVTQYPDAEVVRMRDSADYTAGTVFSGKV
jgi:flagellar protein FlaG